MLVFIVQILLSLANNDVFIQLLAELTSQLLYPLIQRFIISDSRYESIFQIVILLIISSWIFYLLSPFLPHPVIYERTRQRNISVLSFLLFFRVYIVSIILAFAASLQQTLESIRLGKIHSVKPRRCISLSPSQCEPYCIS